MFSWCCDDGFWWSKKCKICDLFSKSHHNDGTKISEKPTFWIKFSKKQYYGTLKIIKIKTKIRQRNKNILQRWPKVYDFSKNIQNQPIEVKKVQNL